MFAVLRHNFGYKLLALFFAIVLHFYVSGLSSARPPHLLVLPLTIRNLPLSLIVNDANLPTVTLTLDGSAEEVNRLTDSAVSAWVDLSHARAGQTPPLTVHLSGLPADVNAESTPPPVILSLEPRLRRQILITADSIGIAPAGYSFAAPIITPREAVISGTRQAVDSVVRLTAQADPDQASGTVDDNFTLAALDASGSPVSDVTVTPSTAHVRMDLVRSVSRKILLVSPSVVGIPASTYRFGSIDVQPATMTAVGRPETLAPVGTLSTRPVDVSGVTSDVVRRVEPIVPAGVTLIPSGSITVTVHILPPPVSVSPSPVSGSPPTPVPSPFPNSSLPHHNLSRHNLSHIPQ